MQFHQMRRVILYLIPIILSRIGILHLIQMANCKKNGEKVLFW